MCSETIIRAEAKDISDAIVAAVRRAQRNPQPGEIFNLFRRMTVVIIS